MKFLRALAVVSFLLGIHLYQANSFSFPSFIDEARDAMMKFSTTTTPTFTIVKPTVLPKPTKTTGGGGGGGLSSRRRSTRRRRSKSVPLPKGKIVSVHMVAPSISAAVHPVGPVGHSYMNIIAFPSVRVRKRPSNNFMDILGKVERSILEAQASGNRRASLKKLTDGIKHAMSKRGYLFARQTLGQALYSALTSRRGKRSTGNPGVQYLQKLKKELGQSAFNNLIGFEDDKTLIFVIDDTGSMSGEIDAVKNISVGMVNELKGKSGIDYILSVFNDPNVGPSFITEDGKSFIQKLNNIRAHDGGDYPELTFQGIQRALAQGPQEGSPMFVFTDATAKDAPTYQKTVIEAAKGFGININFLIRGSAASYVPFVETAQQTCGMILRLPDSNEIRKLQSIALLSLKNFACMSDGDNSGGYSGKRSLSGKSHVIFVDDSVEKLIVSISTTNTPVVTLHNPRGQVQHTGKISLRRAVIYELNKPVPGRWTLTVGASSGKYHYLVRGNSESNIDFDYYFVMTQTSRRRNVTIPISQPLNGRKANTIITVTGAERIQTNNLKLDLLDSKTNRKLRTLTLTQRKRSKAHYIVSFNPPSNPFRFQLRGKTLAGNTFLRSSSKTIKPLSAIIRVYKAMDGLLALPRGKVMYVIMKIFNNGETEKFEVSVSDPLGYLTSRRKQYVKVYSKRERRFMMWFKAAKSAKSGKAYPVAVTIKGRKSGVEAAQVLNMIVK